MIPFANQFYVLVTLSGLLGFLDGLYNALQLTIACDSVGSSQLANQAIGYYHLVISFPVVLGPFIAGLIYDEYHDYQNALIFAGAICILSGLMQTAMMVFFSIFDYSRKKNKA